MNMSVLERIRDFHNEDKRETIEIPVGLFDVAAYASIEKKYKRFLETQIDYFPYMLKSQWRIMYGKSRATGHHAIKELVELKTLGEANYKGCHYVYPLTRAMKWRTKDKSAKPMDSKVKRSSDVPLLDSFMRAEYFLHKGMPLMTNLLPILNVLLKRLEVSPRILPGGYKPLYEKWKGKRIFKNNSLNIELDKKGEPIHIDQNPESYKFIALCINTLIDRRCYFETFSMTKDSLIVNLVVTHFGDTNINRFIEIIEDMNEINNCFNHIKVRMKILCENEDQSLNIGNRLKRALVRRRNSLNISDCIDVNSVSVYNTKIERYFVEGDSDELYKDDLSELERVLSTFKNFMEDKE